jgi:hypothetical protein
LSSEGQHVGWSNYATVDATIFIHQWVRHLTRSPNPFLKIPFQTTLSEIKKAIFKILQLWEIWIHKNKSQCGHLS